MLAQRGSRPDDKSQRSVQVRAPIQAQLKSPTWGSEEDDGPTAHPTRWSARVSASKQEVSQHLPGRRPCNQPRTAAPPALPTAPLDWTTPSCTLPRAPARQGGPTRGGSPLRPRPSSEQRRKHLGSQHNGAHRPPWTRRASRQAGYLPSAHGGTVRLNNLDLRRCSGLTTKHPRPSIDPRGNPARASIERGAASAQATPAAQALGHRTAAVHTRTPPNHSGSDKTTGQRPRTSGRPYGKGNRPSHTTQPQATAISPPAYPTQGRAKAHSRQGNPPRTKSNSGAAALTNTPPLPPAAPSKARSRHAARQRGRPRGGTHQHPSRPGHVELPYANGKPPRTGQSPPSKAYPGTAPAAAAVATALPGKAYHRQGNATASPVHSDTAHGRLHQTQQGPASLRSAGSQRSSATPNPEYPAKRRRHRPSSKGGGQGDKSSEGHQGKKRTKRTYGKRNAHVGLGQPRTRHHAQSGRSGHPSDTVPLATSNSPARRKKCGRTSGTSLEKGPSHPTPLRTLYTPHPWWKALEKGGG
ncbi:hypothetical protein WOLCODRAFT_158659 [Wolfiporia cocos MD-104 SS10]|uniref:Uncharacterized protein n=1 Tax=Wolfiporia cocos (strain MD-104) TaxID=742152 RepID=A0A2H3JA64_WOLCO|nr:hypothetical protein WOLCODRAFT_158659 [Wolfiporia cocos MD-104 SS10]